MQMIVANAMITIDVGTAMAIMFPVEKPSDPAWSASKVKIISSVFYFIANSSSHNSFLNYIIVYYIT